jgi:hypothetical protein
LGQVVPVDPVVQELLSFRIQTQCIEQDVASQCVLRCHGRIEGRVPCCSDISGLPQQELPEHP